MDLSTMVAEMFANPNRYWLFLRMPPQLHRIVTPLPASALIAGLRILGVKEGRPPLPDLEFAIYDKAWPNKAVATLLAVLLTLAQGPSRPAI